MNKKFLFTTVIIRKKDGIYNTKKINDIFNKSYTNYLIKEETEKYQFNESNNKESDLTKKNKVIKIK